MADTEMLQLRRSFRPVLTSKRHFPSRTYAMAIEGLADHLVETVQVYSSVQSEDWYILRSESIRKLEVFRDYLCTGLGRDP